VTLKVPKVEIITVKHSCYYSQTELFNPIRITDNIRTEIANTIRKVKSLSSNIIRQKW